MRCFKENYLCIYIELPKQSLNALYASYIPVQAKYLGKSIIHLMITLGAEYNMYQQLSPTFYIQKAKIWNESKVIKSHRASMHIRKKRQSTKKNYCSNSNI